MCYLFSKIWFFKKKFVFWFNQENNTSSTQFNCMIKSIKQAKMTPITNGLQWVAFSGKTINDSIYHRNPQISRSLKTQLSPKPVFSYTTDGVRRRKKMEKNSSVSANCKLLWFILEFNWFQLNKACNTRAVFEIPNIKHWNTESAASRFIL